ncbi:hypothetical protein F751_0845 [Auxenochlorella protothecoides]|uniref:Uncharacterized protein n=1 Tax=Auxenochlorella protothecoides TaxID=3075 RepID=A0A087SPD2_AUXPR|nr:hypothetical protein F751_0845 [Auxenochlorella protothecoides]KFM27586.1 hypothetical protein F751_0845 [Auxenochlorella protothecoides]
MSPLASRHRTRRSHGRPQSWTVDDHIFMQEALAQVGLDSASASVGAGASCPSHPGDSLEPALPLAIESAGTLCIG